jgi:hypothetical protein
MKTAMPRKDKHVARCMEPLNTRVQRAAQMRARVGDCFQPAWLSIVAGVAAAEPSSYGLDATGSASGGVRAAEPAVEARTEMLSTGASSDQKGDQKLASAAAGADGAASPTVGSVRPRPLWSAKPGLSSLPRGEANSGAKMGPLPQGGHGASRSRLLSSPLRSPGDGSKAPGINRLSSRAAPAFAMPHGVACRRAVADAASAEAPTVTALI